MFRRKAFPQIAIPKPCHEDWAAMPGDERSRFCGACEKSVVNFAGLTQREALKLLLETNGNLCGHIERDAGGKIRFRPEPLSRLAERLVQVSMFGASALAAQAQTCNLEIHVKDASGASISKAKAVAANSTSGDSVASTSDDQGTARSSLPSGKYDLKIESPGFVTFAKRDLVLACESNPDPKLEATLNVGTTGGIQIVTAPGESLVHKGWRTLRKLLRA